MKKRLLSMLSVAVLFVGIFSISVSAESKTVSNNTYLTKTKGSASAYSKLASTYTWMQTGCTASQLCAVTSGYNSAGVREYDIVYGSDPSTYVEVEGTPTYALCSSSAKIGNSHYQTASFTINFS